MGADRPGYEPFSAFSDARRAAVFTRTRTPISMAARPRRTHSSASRADRARDGSCTPSRAYEPGTSSRYHAKLSPPRLWGASTTCWPPTASRAASASCAVSAGVLTTGGMPRR